MIFWIQVRQAKQFLWSFIASPKQDTFKSQEQSLETWLSPQLLFLLHNLPSKLENQEAAKSTEDTVHEATVWRGLQHRLSSYSQKISMYHGLFLRCSLSQNPDWLPVYKPAFTINAENILQLCNNRKGKMHSTSPQPLRQDFRYSDLYVSEGTEILN